MDYFRCPRCSSEFYATSPGWTVNCPYCGHSFKTSPEQRRIAKRTVIQKDCGLIKGDQKVFAQTVDVSRSGIGIKTIGSAQIYKNDTFQVIVKDFDIFSEAKVVWVGMLDNLFMRAGLKFLNADQAS